MAMFEKHEIKLLLPGLEINQFEVTSPQTKNYNCIAWAAGEDDRFWWPDKMGQAYWPKGVPREKSLESFTKAFETLGYETCEASDLEEGFEKIAIFVNALGTPTHAARQLADGNWTSKLGPAWDIKHVLDQIAGFNGKSYGKIIRFMKRIVT